MDRNGPDEMRAVARLPGIDIDILHRRSEEAEAEEMLIRVRAVPSFEAALGAFEAANPFLMWSPHGAGGLGAVARPDGPHRLAAARPFLACRSDERGEGRSG